MENNDKKPSWPAGAAWIVETGFDDDVLRVFYS